MTLPNLLTEEDLDQLQAGVLKTLEEVGVFYQSERILDALAKAGAVVDRSTGVAKLPRQLIEAMIERQKQRPWQPEKERQPRAQGEFRNSFGLQIAPFVYDYERAERRPGNRKDFIELIHFGDALDEDQTVGHVLLMTEEPALVEPLEAVPVMWEHTARPGYTYPHFAEQFPYLEEMGDILYGDPHHFLIGGIFMVSPRRMDRRACNFLLKRLEYGFACSIGTQPVAGASAPVTMAGVIVAGATEILGGWAAIYALDPDRPLSGGVCSGVLDMRTGDVSFCAPEAMLQDLGLCELFRRRYGGHVGVAGGPDYTDARLPGLQAAFEKAFESLSIAHYTGQHPRMGAGLLESGKTFSPVQFLLDRELGSYLWKFAQGIEVNETTLALETIQEVGVGVGRTFLDAPHTLANFRSAVWYPQWLERGVWGAAGPEEEHERRLLDHAQARYREVLAQYQPPEVDPDKLQAVKEVVQRARRELLTP